MAIFGFVLDWQEKGILLGYSVGALASLSFNLYLILTQEWKACDLSSLVSEDEEELFYTKMEDDDED